MKKTKILILLLLCLLCGCKEKEKVEKYIIPGNIAFSPDESYDIKKTKVDQMKFQQEGKEKPLEDAYIDGNGDLVVILTEKQKMQEKSNYEMVMNSIMSHMQDEVTSYIVNPDKTSITIDFKTKDNAYDEYNQKNIDNALDMMFIYQIYEGVLAENAEILLILNYSDTGETEQKVYKCEDMPLIK